MNDNQQNVMNAGEETAREAGFTDMQQVRASVTRQVQNYGVTTNLSNFVGGFISQLLGKVLKQSIVAPKLSAIYKLWERIPKKYVSNGNSWEYVFKIGTGMGTYNPAAFVPGGQTAKLLNGFTISYKNTTGIDTTHGSFELFKEFTDNSVEWIYYFVDGKLSQYITSMIEDMEEQFTINMFNRAATLWTDSTNPGKRGKVVTSNATNLFDALVEFLPLVDKMTQYNSFGNVSTIEDTNGTQWNNAIHPVNPEDIIILGSTNVISYIKNGIQSQMFNYQLLGTNVGNIKPEQFIALGTKITQTNSETANVDTDTDWINDTTLFAIDISDMRYTEWVSLTGSQFYPTNRTLYMNKLVRGNLSYMPWCKKLTFNFTSVTNIPTQISETGNVSVASANQSRSAKK